VVLGASPQLPYVRIPLGKRILFIERLESSGAGVERVRACGGMVATVELHPTMAGQCLDPDARRSSRSGPGQPHQSG